MPNATEKRDARILVVEDNKVNLNLMLAYLKKNQLATLYSAENGCLAVEAVKRQDDDSYDIIFIGEFSSFFVAQIYKQIKLVKTFPCGRWTGFEAARAIRALETERSPDSTPAMIIALTGLSSSEDGSKALASGMDMFMTKPVSFKNIGKLLKGWTEKRSERE
jgi:CheY-like chemotaxis protein